MYLLLCGNARGGPADFDKAQLFSVYPSISALCTAYLVFGKNNLRPCIPVIY